MPTNFQRDRKVSISKKKQAAQALQEVSGDEDPFNFLGFGMVAYRDLMLVMILLFGAISLLMAPTMYFYS